jgi:adenosylhomocysteinase
MMKSGTLLFPAINVNDSSPSQVRQHLRLPALAPDGLAAGDRRHVGGKLAVVFGYGEVGKGCAQALRGQGCPVITEIDPICALQARWKAMTSSRSATSSKADLFITATATSTSSPSSTWRG